VNAAQAIEGQNKPGIVSVAVVSEGDHVVIRVSDSGPGVPDHLKQKIFEPFVTTKPTGMGIGLSFCNRVIAEHGGYIEVGDSRLGGAEFITHIPVDGRRRTTGS
jgi:two-component system sensor kinase FixL